MEIKKIPRDNKVICIIILFKPNIELSKKALKSIEKNTKDIIIVNNGPEIPELYQPNSATIINLGKNSGLSKAQNLGITIALKQNPDFIWLSDQDTVYPDNFLKNILREVYFLKNHFKVASISPCHIDREKKTKQGFFKRGLYTKKYSHQNITTQTSHNIASGMLIDASILKAGELMLEELFIDWIDIEWCWRVEKKGYGAHFWTGKICIEHQVGDESTTLFAKRISMHSPLRHYYMIRNAIYIALYTNSAPINIAAELLLKSIVWTVLFPSIAPKEKRDHFKMSIKGLADGFKGVTGKIDKS